MKKKRDAGESLLQIAYHSWMPHALPEVFTWHIRNEHAQNEIQGKIYKDRGVKPGIHDNGLIWPGHYATLELKNPNIPASKNKYSPKQLEYAQHMDRCGFMHACCQNGEQIEETMFRFGLRPLFRFPAALASTKKLMLQQAVMDAMYRRD